MKLTVATSFPVFPPRGGGQQRIWGLYSVLAREGIDVDIVALVDAKARGGVRRLAPRIREIRVPKTPEHEAAEHKLQQLAGVPVTDVTLTLHHDRTPAYGEALAASARDATAVVASHPFAQPAIAAACDAPLIYEAHNVEADLKAAMIHDEQLLDAVRDVEKACCDRAHHVMVCAEDDGERLSELYGLDPRRSVLVPNGVDPDSVEFTPAALRSERKARVGLADRTVVLFLGSWHEPNVVAGRDVLAAADELPELRFLVIGGVGIPLALEAVPDNVDLCGIVDGRFVASVLGIADVAVNPMHFGSGTNLKMLDYALAGVPVVSTAVGARGLGLEPGRHYVEVQPRALAAGLREALEQSAESVAARVAAARSAIRAGFAWPVIAHRWLDYEGWSELRAGVPA